MAETICRWCKAVGDEPHAPECQRPREVSEPLRTRQVYRWADGSKGTVLEVSGRGRNRAGWMSCKPDGYAGWMDLQSIRAKGELIVTEVDDD